MKITLLTDQYNSRWDEYIRQSPEGSFYQLAGWKNIIEKSLRLKPIYLMALNESDEISGVLPLFLMRDIVGRKYLISIPFFTNAGVCADDKEVKIELLNKATEIVIEERMQYLELRQLADEVYQLPTKTDFITMIIKLVNDEDIIWKTYLNKRRRTAVRKAQNEGLTFEFNKNYFDAFYKIVSINHRDLGTPHYPKLLLWNCLEEFSSITNLAIVKYQNRVIAGTLFVSYKNVIIPLWAASIKEYNNLRPNDLLYWEVIKYACRNGFEYFDFGRSTVNSGTFDFKKNWGAEPVQLHYQYFLNKADKIPVHNVHNNKYQLAINVWKKMPMMIANVLGPRVIRYLPEL